MKNKEISKSRRNFRRVLYTLAALSFIFFASIVTLRVNKSLQWQLGKEYWETVFYADIVKHQTLAYFEDQDGQHDLAVELVKNGLFSKKYSAAGLIMLKDVADQGHAKSQFVYGNILYRRNPVLGHQEQAIAYLESSAEQGYEPAQLKMTEHYNLENNVKTD